MKQEYKRPVMFAAAVFFVFCCVYSGAKLIAFYSAEYPKWIGNSRDGNWQAVIKKAAAPQVSAEIHIGPGSRLSSRDVFGKIGCYI